MASTTAVTSLNGVSNVSNGSTVDFAGAKRIVSAAIVPSAGVTSGLVVVQASQDGTNWIDIAVVETVAGVNRGFDNGAGAYRYWRANVLTKINGGTVVVTFMEAG